MASRIVGDGLRDYDRDLERERRVEHRHERIVAENLRSDDDQEEMDEQGDQNDLPQEDIVEIIAPLLKEKPQPLNSFDDPCIPDFVKHVVKSMNFTEPTVIQKYCSLY